MKTVAEHQIIEDYQMNETTSPMCENCEVRYASCKDGLCKKCHLAANLPQERYHAY